jgi:hypothetical protein
MFTRQVVRAAQKMNFAAIRPTRGGPWIEVIRPNVERTKYPFGLLNWARLNALKNSARIYRVMSSRIVVPLCSVRFQLFKPGPWKKGMATTPNRGCA